MIKSQNEIVILIHGMARTRFSMLILDRYLKRNGYETVTFSYSSTRHDIETLTAKFADFLIELSEKNKGKLFHIVSHSLGGILTREVLLKLGLGDTKESSKTVNIGRIVMLAPPNKGSKAASFFSRIWPIPQILKPITELRNAEDSPINDIHIPQNIDIGVIAGRFDRKVTPEESHINSEKDHIIVNSAHTFIMNNKNVKQAVLNFLRTGSFDKNNKKNME